VALALALGCARVAHAQVGVGFPVTTMPSPTAPSPTPTPVAPPAPVDATPSEAVASPPAVAPAAVPNELAVANAETDKALQQLKPERKFGDEGEVVISGQLAASLGFLSYDHGPASSKYASVEPAFDFFVRRNVLLGASTFIRYSSGTSGIGLASSSVAYGVQARFGGNLPIGKLCSFRPVGALGVWSQHTSFEQAQDGFATSVGGTAVRVGPSVTETVLVVSVFAPFLVHPAPHLFLGLGPEAYKDIAHAVGNSSNNRTFIGISSTVGGWF
jgi:hypothetical protein